MQNVNYKIFSVGNDRPEIIAAQTAEEALNQHIQNIGSGWYTDSEIVDISEVPINAKAKFEQESGGYKEMTFAEFLGDFMYTEPQTLCWME